MNSTRTRQTSITADPNLPTIRIEREFAAPVDRVFRAWTDPALFTRWIGPRDRRTTIAEWDARTGGHWRYSVADTDGGQVASFYGSFHEVRPHERLVQTFTYEGYPDGVSLETATFTDLGDGRTSVSCLSVVESLELRDSILSSGMDTGVIEGYEKLDALLR